MPYIAAPAFRPASITWTIDSPSGVNVSAYTGTRSVQANPWHCKWSAHVQLATIQGQNGFSPIMSFIARCRGSTNFFRLNAVVGPQNNNSGVTVANTAVAGSSQLSLSGYATPLAEGQFFTVNGQLCCLVGDQAGTVVMFEPRLRETAVAGTPVATSTPYALVYMTSPQFGYRIGPARMFDTSFDVEEAVLAHGGLQYVTFDETDVSNDE